MSSAKQVVHAPSSNPAAPSPANLLDVYDVDNGTGIGIGALARVLRVTSHVDGTTAAVKILSKLQLLQMQKVQSIKMEKRVLQLFGRDAHTVDDRRHVAKLYGTDQSEDEIYLFMEELTGGDLQEHLSRVAKMRIHHHSQLSAPTPPQPSPQQLQRTSWLPGLFCLSFTDVRLILAQLLDALEPIHTHPGGFTLRDLKSENICFDASGVLVLIDFDAADEQRGLEPESNYGDPLGRKREAQQMKNLSSNPTGNTSLGAQQARLEAEARRKTVSEIQGARKMSLINFVGTTQFVSPELLGQMKWSFSSDLWALGVVLYQCVFGRYPFDGTNPFEIMKEIVRGIEPWRHFPLFYDTKTNSHPDTSLFTENQYAAVCDLIESLLQLDPVRRIGVTGSLERREGGISSPTTTTTTVEGKGPEYSQLRNHPLFANFDWEDMRARVVVLAATAGTTVPPTSSSSSLASLYNIPPTHDEAYSVDVDDACAVGSPITDWVLGHKEEEDVVQGEPTTISTEPTAIKKMVDTPTAASHNRVARMEADLATITAKKAWLDTYVRKHLMSKNRGQQDVVGVFDDDDDGTAYVNRITIGQINAHRLHLELEAKDVLEQGQHDLKTLDEAIELQQLQEKKKIAEELLLVSSAGEHLQQRGRGDHNGDNEDKVGEDVTFQPPASSSSQSVTHTGVSNPYAPTTVRLDAIDIRRILEEDNGDEDDDTDHRIVDDVGIQNNFGPVDDDFKK